MNIWETKRSLAFPEELDALSKVLLRSGVIHRVSEDVIDSPGVERPQTRCLSYSRSKYRV